MGLQLPALGFVVELFVLGFSIFKYDSTGGLTTRHQVRKEEFFCVFLTKYLVQRSKTKVY